MRLLLDHADAPPGLTIFPVQLRPYDVESWQDAQIQARAPAGGTVESLASEAARTSAGWPVRLVEARVISPAGETIECGLHAFYSFFDHVAHALAQAPNIDILNSHREAWRKLLLGARPDLGSDAIVALCQL